jgi:hypothetical protein
LSAESNKWKTGTPGVYGFKVLTCANPAEKAIIQEGLTGGAWEGWALFEPHRCIDGGFKRRLCGKLKQARISMLATMGYIRPR